MRTSAVALSRIRNARKIILMLPGISQTKLGRNLVYSVLTLEVDFSTCPVTPKMEVEMDGVFSQGVLARLNYTSVIFK